MSASEFVRSNGASGTKTILAFSPPSPSSDSAESP